MQAAGKDRPVRAAGAGAGATAGERTWAMLDERDLRHMLRERDRRGYPAYKDLRGAYEFGDLVLSIDHVQGDPFAAPSKVSAFVDHRDAGFPRDWLGLAKTGGQGGHAGQGGAGEQGGYAGQGGRGGGPALDNAPLARQRRRALEDFIVRRLFRELAHASARRSGSGKSGLLATSRPGPEVLERTACEIRPDGIVVRFELGLPAHGRSIDARAAEDLLCDLAPRAIRQTLMSGAFDGRDSAAAREAVELAEDQLVIRQELTRRDLVAFVADGSVLPRESGVSSQPMRGALPFSSPDSLRVTLDLPHRGPTAGMGIPRGVTLVVGGGYHGKSTLLQALQAGVYDHVAGDGRELVVCDETACKLRAEDGRSVAHVDVAPFIGDLPCGIDTRDFSTTDASGSTSQAASTIEAVEAGAQALLIDEDTSATNFMVRDALMEAVVARESEPITPFVERVRDLYGTLGVSSIIVAGSSGAFFGVADLVLQMDRYRCLDITDRARAVWAEWEGRATSATGASPAAGGPDVAAAPFDVSPRKLGVRGKTPAGGPHGSRADRDGREGRGAHGHGGHGRPNRIKVRTQGTESLQVGDASADLRLVEQVVDPEQVSALAQMVRQLLERGSLSSSTVEDAADELLAQIRSRGLGSVGSTTYVACGLALPRRQEICACLNRLRM